MTKQKRDGTIVVTVMDKTRGGYLKKGFALPTVMIASVVMLIILLSSLVAVSSTNVAIRNQVNLKLASEAAQAGVAMVNACLAANSNSVTWTTSLAPNTDCTGTVVGGASAYVLDTTNVKTTFSVPPPTLSNGVNRTIVTATLSNYRTSTGTVSSTITTSSAATVGTNSFSNIAFGYSYNNNSSTDGAQFIIVLPDGTVKGVGQNMDTRLGNCGGGIDGPAPGYWACGSSNQLTPITYTLPGGETGVAAFTSFLSVGRQVFILTSSGKVYGSGYNANTQLGTNVISRTPQLFPLPGSVKGRFVAPLGTSTFVMGDDNNIYAAGDCSQSQLGTGCTTGSITTPTRVVLPAVNTNDLNTLPETSPGWLQATNMAVDRFNAYVRMKGGYVYGWGLNDYGQLGDGTTTNSPTPKRITATLSSATPNFTQIAWNGQALYLLDTNGQVWAAGDNSWSEQAGAGARIQSSNGNCLYASTVTVGAPLTISVCPTTNPGADHALFEEWPDATIRLRANVFTSTPSDTMYCVSDDYPTNSVSLRVCNGSAAQTWNFGAQGIWHYNGASIYYMTNTGTSITMSTSFGSQQQWKLMYNPWLRPVPPPPFASSYAKVVRITTDNGSVHMLDEFGRVWAAGSNNKGQLGTGNPASMNFQTMDNVRLTQAALPGGSKVADVYNTEADPTAATITWPNGGSYNNTFYVLTDGSVYGTGSNAFGQLGNGSPLNYVYTPVKMNLPSEVKAKSVVAGWGTAVVLTKDGRIFTLGNNSNGQLGDGTQTNSSTPTANQYTNLRALVQY
jgi:alpha-tubulin suppressor-like RCC1 family protein/Tfp pilus assembly protein PilV